VATELIEVRVPDIGDYKDVEVIEVVVKAGETIALESTLVTLETEKAAMDVPSSVAGVVKEVRVQRGARVSKGDVIALVESVISPASAGAGPSPQPSPAKAGEGVEPSPQPSPAKAGEGVDPSPQPSPARAGEGAGVPEGDFGFSRSHASPSIRKLARELGVDLPKVQGTGAKGRILEADVKAYVKRILSQPVEPAGASLPRVPDVDFAAFGAIERKPLSRIQKISGPRLHASWVNIPHVTQFDDADITAMEEARTRMKADATARGIKLTPLAFVMRACVLALQTYPNFCASLDAAAGELVLKKYVHIGFAADTPGGLVVPVVRDADRLDVFGLAAALGTLSEKARSGKLSAAEMQGGCFTISSLGGIGGTAFTPVINAPEVAILGVSRSALRPVYQNGSFVPRLVLPLSLSYDHRVIDGAAAARFTSFLAQALADVPGLLRPNT
jgi:pyruvate dehydrogenase E2 component (dihydrolipoamide acetyltransferase)